MKTFYTFEMESETLEYSVEVDRAFDFKQARDSLPEWVKLKHHQCPNCPLTVKDCQYCPAAVDLAPVITDFRGKAAGVAAHVQVKTADRVYGKTTTLEAGLRSLMGLIMASSACPILKNLLPNARHHLPFATQKDFITRSAALYLLSQYFRYREGHRPDWDLQGLVSLNQELQMLNQAFWQRVSEACADDSNLKALLSFLDMSTSVGETLEDQLQSIKDVMLSGSAL